jgi:hypothetical protein
MFSKVTTDKVDEANVDTSNFVESSNIWIRVLIRNSGMLAIANQDPKFEIVEIEVEGGVDLGSRSKTLYFPGWCYGRGVLCYCLMLCNWTTSLANSTWGFFANEN